MSNLQQKVASIYLTRLLISSSEHSLSLGQWHTIKISRTARLAVLKVCQKQVERYLTLILTLSLSLSPAGRSASGGHDHFIEWLLASVAGAESICGRRQSRGPSAIGSQVQVLLCGLHSARKLA